MIRSSIFIFLLLVIACAADSGKSARQQPVIAAEDIRNPGRVIHVIVALCDNQYQGIVPVPARIGNGDDPSNNLYWGARFGVKTYFKRAGDWRLVAEERNPRAEILERLVFK